LFDDSAKMFEIHPYIKLLLSGVQKNISRSNFCQMVVGQKKMFSRKFEILLPEPKFSKYCTIYVHVHCKYTKLKFTLEKSSKTRGTKKKYFYLDLLLQPNQTKNNHTW
jgi:hypothetical protein